jgi:hypothetical protein
MEDNILIQKYIILMSKNSYCMSIKNNSYYKMEVYVIIYMFQLTINNEGENLTGFL